MKCQLLLGISLLLLSSCSIFQKMGGRHGKLISGETESPAQLITSFPFRELTGGVLLLEAAVDGVPDSLNFIFDTGSGGISLDSATCAYYDIEVDSSDRFIRGIGGIRRVFFAYDKTLSLPGLKIDSLDFHISDYGFISSVYGLNVDGIIGYSFMKDYIIQVNYDSMRMYVYTPGRYEYEGKGDLLRPAIGNIPIIPGNIDNKLTTRSHLYFDMGAGLCLMLSNRYVNDSCLFCSRRQRRHKFIETEAQGFMGKINMTQTVIQRYRIGKYHFRKVPAYLFDDVSNVTNYPLLAGLVGNDLLRRFNVTLNYPRNEIYLSPNKFFNEPFDYAYTGIVMYYIDGHIVITDVLKGSPAEKAGFQEGDIIVAVNNSFNNDIQEYRQQLKATGSRVKVIINRGGTVMQLKLSIKSIL